ncbi:MAG: transcriptional regulator, MarR family [Paenibacillaceae bacterium]|nr:transcriptional regulator, MarR family [Paenibacillaceae bacterium]
MEDKQWLLLEEADWYFRKMVRRFVKERDKITVEGMTLPAFMILRKLERDGEQRLGDLAEEFDFTSGAVTALSDKLEEAGLAWRRRLEEDRRTVFLSVTDKGKDFLVRNGNIGLHCIAVLFEGFTEDELQQQAEFYRRIFDNLEHFSSAILKLAESNSARQMQQHAAGETSGQAITPVGGRELEQPLKPAGEQGQVPGQAQEQEQPAPKSVQRRPDANKYFTY